MVQSWHDLLFAHWPVAQAALRSLVPPQLQLQTYEGQCWVGVVPFWMSGVRVRGLPPIPGTSRFPELNVRTYVTFGGKPGVFFFSLDAANRLAVKGAQAFFHLPYFYARMKAELAGDEVVYGSVRKEGSAEFTGRYRAIAPVVTRPEGTLAHWLTERYCLYTVHDGRVYRGDIHHKPWPLQDATAEITRNSMAVSAGIDLPEIAPLLHFAKRQDVLIWPLRQVG
jgi:uncharacterized protein